MNSLSLPVSVFSISVSLKSTRESLILFSPSLQFFLLKKSMLHNIMNESSLPSLLLLLVCTIFSRAGLKVEARESAQARGKCVRTSQDKRKKEHEKKDWVLD